MDGNGSDPLTLKQTNEIDPNEKILRRFVTADDTAKYLGGGVVNYLIPAFSGAFFVSGPLPPELPSISQLTPFNKGRDAYLALTPAVEGFWATALHIAISKVVSRGVEFEGPVSRRIDAMNELWRVCDGRRGFPKFLSRHLRDFYTTGNGGWVEIERVSRNPNAKIVSFHHLDSLRVWRTGDPETPAVYWDLHGKYHELRWWEVFNVSQMESPRAGGWWGGECAAERVYRDVRAMSSMTTYFDEKITGGGYHSLVFVPGFTIDQLEQAAKAATEQQLAKGIVYYQGKLVIPLWGDVKEGVSVQEIKLKGMPDDWDRQKEFDIRLLHYADTLGIPPMELDPRLSARGAMGVGAQSAIIDENEQGRGFGDWEKQFVGMVNEFVTPKATVFSLTIIDLRDEQMRAKNYLTRAQARTQDVTSGVMTVEQGLYKAILDDDAPREFMSGTAPLEETISDVEKPLSDTEQSQEQSFFELNKPNPGLPSEDATVKGTWRSMDYKLMWLSNEIAIKGKRKDDPAKQLLEQEKDKARQLFNLVRNQQSLTRTKEVEHLPIVVPPSNITIYNSPPTPPQVTVMPAEITIKESQPQVIVQVEPTPVTIQNEQHTHVEPTPITNEQHIHIEPTPITIENEQHTHVEPTPVNIDAPVTVNVPEQKGATFRVTRDQSGNIAEIEKETNG